MTIVLVAVFRFSMRYTCIRTSDTLCELIQEGGAIGDDIFKSTGLSENSGIK